MPNANTLNTNVLDTNLFLRQATIDDAKAIVNLLNQTFRSDVGWTNESHLISGIRTTVAEIESVIDDPDNSLFIYPEVNNSTSEETGKVLASISLKFNRLANNAYIGLFAVDSDLQGNGIGNQVLKAAENFAILHLRDDINQHEVLLTMSILTQRPELKAYYERRGYQLNGNSQPFPMDSNNGEPKVDDLRLLEMFKIVK